MHNLAMNSEPSKFQRLLACLGDRSRYRVVLALNGDSLCVSDLARTIGLSQSCTTRHLQVLGREGLVRRTRVGKRVFFSLRSDEPEVEALVRWALGIETRRMRSATPQRVDAGGQGLEGAIPAAGVIDRISDKEIAESKSTEEPTDNWLQVNELEDYLL